MSTGLECEFVEYQPGKWYYILQNYDCPAVTWDWREYATAYGPFPTMEAGREHLFRNHANPGGYSVLEYGPDYAQDSVMRQLVERARK